jgi:hypothetical protein
MVKGRILAPLLLRRLPSLSQEYPASESIFFAFSVL